MDHGRSKVWNKILEALPSDGGSSVDDIATGIGASVVSVKKALSRMAKLQLAANAAANKGGRGNRGQWIRLERAADTIEEIDEYPTAPPELGLPWPLAKALIDSPFSYMVGLRDGSVLYVEGITAERVGGTTWITLRGGGREEDAPKVIQYGTHLPDVAAPWPRGLCVRLSEVVWCSDAPYGS